MVASAARAATRQERDSCPPCRGKSLRQGDKSLAPLLLLACLLVCACTRSSRPLGLNKVVRLAKFGDFDQATALLERIEAVPSAKLPDQARYIAVVRKHVEEFRRAHVSLDARLQQHLAAEPSSYKVLRWLKAKRDKLDNRYLNDALVAKLSRYDDWVAQVRGDGEQTSRLSSPIEEMGVYFATSEAELSGASIQHVLDEIHVLSKAGNFVQAIQLVSEQLPTAGKDEDRLRDILWQVEDAAEKKMSELLTQAEAFTKRGRLDEAIAFLGRAAKNFPERGRLSHLHRQKSDYEFELRRSKGLVAKKPASLDRDPVPEAEEPELEPVDVGIKRSGVARNKRVDDSRKNLDDLSRMTQSELRRARRGLAVLAREAVKKHAFTEAMEHYKLIGSICRLQAPQLSDIYQTLELEARLMARSLASLPAAIKADGASFKRIDIGYGEMAKVLAADENGLSVQVGKDREEVPYMSVPDKSLAVMLRIAAKSSEESLGAALIAYRGLGSNVAESLLQKALSLDRDKKPFVDRILAHHRKEDPGPGGYMLLEGRFVSSRSVLLKEAIARFEKGFNKLMQIGNVEVRNRAYVKLLEENAAQRYFLVDALKARKEKLFVSLGKVSFKTKLSKLRKARDELDNRRSFAKELIFDTVKYFYPYRPPEVAAEKAKLYSTVQADVSKRAAAIREIWNGNNVALTLPKKVVKELDFYRWLSEMLSGLSSETKELDKKMGTLLAARGRMTIRNFASDTKERSFLERGDKIVADNVKLLARLLEESKVNREQVALVGITNRYRRMFGHMPLIVDERLMRAAQGHAAEMTNLGYFSHTSPTEGRRTPGERMRLQGYKRGGGENIARNFNAMAAHISWIHSSGHHRNLLSTRHRDIGVGANGSSYVQNFGAGSN